MKTTIIIVSVLAFLVLMISPAISEARGGYYGRPYYGHGGHGYYRGGGWGYGGAAVGGFIAGAIVGSAMRPAPVYVAPPPRLPEGLLLLPAARSVCISILIGNG